jgi:hypothetical protein
VYLLAVAFKKPGAYLLFDALDYSRQSGRADKTLAAGFAKVQRAAQVQKEFCVLQIHLQWLRNW